MPGNRVTTGLRRLMAFMLLSVILPACQPMVKQDADNAASNTATENTLLVQARESLNAGDTELAIQQFEQLLEKDSSVKQGYTDLGLLYLAKQDVEQAQKAFKNAIEQDNEDAIAYNHLAVIQRQQGLFQQALSNYEKAIEANPDYANAYLNLGILYDIYLQQLDAAVEQYERYQQLTNNTNEDVDKWLIDIKRRIDDQKADEK